MQARQTPSALEMSGALSSHSLHCAMIYLLLFVNWCLEFLTLANMPESFIIPSYHIDVKFDCEKNQSISAYVM
jgi:hypothetical protein